MGNKPAPYCQRPQETLTFVEQYEQDSLKSERKPGEQLDEEQQGRCVSSVRAVTPTATPGVDTARRTRPTTT
jgi:hypothetical protein